MLVLSRKRNEVIRIAEDILVMVLGIRGDKVRLGVTAPEEIPVHREEVFEAIHRKMEQGISLRQIEDDIDLEENKTGMQDPSWNQDGKAAGSGSDRRRK